MTHTLRLLYGDKRAPTRQLSLSGSGGKIYLRENGFAPGPGEEIVIWTGSSARFDGQQLAGLGRDNARLSLTYDLVGGSAAELSYWQREITRFFEEASRYELSREGNTVWLEYRWQEGLDDLVAPVWGQLSYYWRIYLATRPKWPESLHSGDLVASNIQEVVINLEGAPVWEGVRQKAMTAKGQVEIGKYGVLVCNDGQNDFTNPSFGHATWDTGWTASNSLLRTNQEPRLAYSLNSAARLVNGDSSAHVWRQTLTLTADDYTISCRGRRLDGAAVTTADMVLWGQGGVVTTTFKDLGDGWYLAYGTFNGLAASSTHGVQVKAGRSVIVDDFLLSIFTTAAEDRLTPFLRGDLIGCSWAGTAHNSVSTRPLGQMKATLSKEFTGQFTAAGWFTPNWDSGDAGSASTGVFEYRVTSADRVLLQYSNNAVNLNRFVIKKDHGGYTAIVDTSNVTALSYLTPVHLALVQDRAGLKLYINGVLDNNVNNTSIPSLTGGGVLGLGSGTDISLADAWFDGWRVWDTPLTAAQILAVYNNELPVKQAGGTVGTPAFLWNVDGDGILDAVDGVVSSAAKDNWGIVAGVAGDVPALAEWQITGLDSRVYWLGLKATKDAFKPAGSLWLDYSGTADSGASSGDAYESGASDFDATISADIAVLVGRCQVLARFRATVAQAIVRPYYRLGGAAGSLIEGDDVTVPISSGFLFQDFGELRFDWLENQPKTIDVGLRVRERSLYQNLISFWKLADVNDAMGLYNLTNNNAVTFSTGKIGNAGYFASASSQYLSRADNADLSAGDTSFTISCWVYLTTKSAIMDLVGKWNTTGSQREYLIEYNNADDRFEFLVSTNGSDFPLVKADSLGSPATATWYHIVAWHDHIRNEIGIKVNNTYVDIEPHAGGVFDGTAAFTIGARATPTNYLNGRCDAVGFWKRILTEEEHTWLYNNGTGLEHPFFSATCALDFIQLLPRPACRIEAINPLAAAAATDALVIIGKRAYSIDTNGDRELFAEHIGDEVNPLPNLYNHIFLLPGHEGQAYNVTWAATVGLYVTPRWLLPGGAVA